LCVRWFNSAGAIFPNQFRGVKNMNFLNATFLNEPYKKWFIFFGVALCFLVVWGGVLRAVRG